MAPQILLYNDMTTRIISKIPEPQITAPIRYDLSHDAANSISDFLSLVDATLNKTSQFTGPLSPIENVADTVAPGSHTASEIQNAIELALLRSNAAPSRRSANRFEISRSGERIAIIVLTRSAYRLGEAIFATIDFQESEVPCYSLNATLESSELIDTAIALRSRTSIQRATRRIHASESICTMFNRRVTFSPTIPPAATPDFVTSGISLEWVLRFEFVTGRTKRELDVDKDWDCLFEEVGRDERNIIYSAVQGFPCESFDVTVPLRVYGARCGIDESSLAENFPIWSGVEYGVFYYNCERFGHPNNSNILSPILENALYLKCQPYDPLCNSHTSFYIKRGIVDSYIKSYPVLMWGDNHNGFYLTKIMWCLLHTTCRSITMFSSVYN